MNKILREAGSFVVMLALGALVGIAFASLLPDFGGRTRAAEASDNTLWSLAVLLLQLGGISFGVILIHELGHSFGGYLADYKPHQVTVGVLTIDFSGRYWRLRWNSDLTYAMGVCFSLPKHNRHSRWRYLAYVISGPLSTLLTGLLSFGLWLSLPPSALTQPLLLCALISASIFVATCLPVRAGLLPSDGYRAMKLIFKYDDEARAWIATTDMMAVVASGQSLQAIDQSLFDAVRANPHDTYSAIAYDYALALEIGDTEGILQSATAFQNMLADDLPSFTRKTIERELAFVYGWVAPDREQFQRYYDNIAKTLTAPAALNYRVIAAHQRMAGQVGALVETLRTAQHFLQTDRPYGYGSEQVIINRLLAETPVSNHS